MSNDLKPCPFCKSKGTTRSRQSAGTMYVNWAVGCSNLKCVASSGLVTFRYDTEEEAIAAWNRRAVDGDTSDGYHTFNELYHHRAVLFSKVVQFAGERAWRSKLHADGTMFEGYFIVGVETPEGQATYHYAIDPYWEMFDCKEVEQAPVWDGHTPQEAIARIERWNQCAERIFDCGFLYEVDAEGFEAGNRTCPSCNEVVCSDFIDDCDNWDYCPYCGVRVG